MSKILDFKKDNGLKIRAKSPIKAEIVIYGTIGDSWFEDSISAKQFSDELKKIEPSVKEIDVRINSVGGDVFSGLSIYNRLKQHPAKITVYIDGLAASIASIIALAGDEVIMGEGALFMIHLPWTMAAGNRNEMENTINRLMDVEEQMIGIYAKKSGMGRSEIKSLLEKESWMDADQAIENGFVDSTAGESIPIAASVLGKASWINKTPKCKTQTDVAKIEIEKLQNKISGFISRK